MQPQALQSEVSRIPIPAGLIAPRPVAAAAASRKASWSKPVSKSAGNDIQLYGKRRPTLREAFDMGGLIGWLKSRFPTSTAYHIQAATGIAAHSVENWLARRSRPSAEHLSILVCVFGPSLFRAAIRHQATWIDRACEAESLDEIDQQISRLTSERAALMK